MNLTELRATIALALDGVDDDVWVHDAPVDAIDPPAYIIEPFDPWGVPASFCQANAQVDVVCVVARLEPSAQLATLENIVADAWGALAAVGLTPVNLSKPLPLDVAQVDYLAARLTVRALVEFPTAQPLPRR